MMQNAWFPPMEPIRKQTPPDGERWIHQIKYDGIRLLCWIEDGAYRLFTRNRQIRLQQYPEFARIFQSLNTSSSLLLDGEAIVRDDRQKPQFSLVLRRDQSQSVAKATQLQQELPIEYQVFDILMLDGQDLRGLPLHKRIDRLQQLVKPSDWLKLVDSTSDGRTLLQHMEEQHWEGIVSKRLDAPYTPGKHHRDWFKTKVTYRLLCVIGGVQLKDGHPNALLLGLYRGETLEYIGKLASGLTSQDLALLHAYLPSLEQDEPPFRHPPKHRLPVRWLRPALTLWATYSEWTADGHLRHPRLHGFSTQPAAKARWKR